MSNRAGLESAFIDLSTENVSDTYDELEKRMYGTTIIIHITKNVSDINKNIKNASNNCQTKVRDFIGIRDVLGILLILIILIFKYII